VAATLVPLHIAPHAKRLAATGKGAFERFFSRVGVAVDPERAGTGEGLVASRADVPVLALRERC
jgi:hypothetical protein